jgi:hypothetical protein
MEVLRGGDQEKGMSQIGAGISDAAVGLSMLAGQGLYPGLLSQYREVKAGYGKGAATDQWNEIERQHQGRRDTFHKIATTQGVDAAKRYWRQPEIVQAEVNYWALKGVYDKENPSEKRDAKMYAPSKTTESGSLTPPYKSKWGKSLYGTGGSEKSLYKKKP